MTCRRCDEEAGSYFVSRKLNDRQMDEAMEFVRKEDIAKEMGDSEDDSE